MPKKKDKLIEKFVKKDYNNEMETILENKNYEENSKSILLSILYKIEAAYKDYAKVKVDVETKEEYIQNIIRTIQKDCKEIKLVALENSEENKILGTKTFLVDKKLKKIICYPIERKLLYAIAKIGKREKIVKEKYEIVDKTISNLINTGNNINIVEPLRDFNGYSWTSIPRELESIGHNLVYQNIRLLVGNTFLMKWIKNKEYIIDYYDLFRTKLEEEYTKEQEQKITNLITQISILLEMKFDKDAKRKILACKKETEKDLKNMENKAEYLQSITQKKRELEVQIKELDETRNNKALLQQEYKERNELLPLDKKIFSLRILSQFMQEERKQKMKQLKELNDLLKPQKFLAYRSKLEQRKQCLAIAGCKDLEKEIKTKLVEFQKVFLQCYATKIKKVKTKQEMLNQIYEFRYYNLLPIYQEERIYEQEELEKDLDNIQKQILQKARELKLMEPIYQEKEVNDEIVKNIFYVRMINLENIDIQITKEKDEFYVQLFDEGGFEEKKKRLALQNLAKKLFCHKLNKKIKIFN